MLCCLLPIILPIVSRLVVTLLVVILLSVSLRIGAVLPIGAVLSIGLLPVAFDALERLVVDLEEDTGSHDLLITSGHRTVAEQQEAWDYYMNLNGEEYTNAYVAKPGFSEHNTGLACDVSFYTDDGASIPVSEYEHGWWLAAHSCPA